MSKAKFMVTGAVTLGIVALAPAAFAAEPIVITPGSAADKTVTYVDAGPTRMFNVEKAITLPHGESRVGASLQVGGLGLGGTTPGIAGGVNLRADTGFAPGMEAGISVSGLGGTGVSNLLGQITLRGKMALTEFSVGAMPVEVGGLATAGAFAGGTGIGNANVALGIPLTLVPSNRFNLTVTPGVGFGFGAGGFLPGGAPATVNAGGLYPALGLGLDYMLTERLQGIVDGNLGFSGLPAQGALGLRYGVTEDLAADLFVGYQGNPLQAVNAGTIGLGGYYAF